MERLKCLSVFLGLLAMIESKIFLEQFVKPEVCEVKIRAECNCFYASQVVPYQIAIANFTVGTALIIDSLQQQAAIINMESGQTILVNSHLKKGVLIERENSTSNSMEELADSLPNYSISEKLEAHNNSVFDIAEIANENIIELTEQKTSLIEENLAIVFGSFGHDLYDYIKDIGGSIFSGVIKLLKELMEPLAELLKPITTLITTGGWWVTKSVHAIWKIIKTVAKFVVSIGLDKLIKWAIKIPLELIIFAVNGLKSLVVLLYELGKKVKLKDIFNIFILTPLRIFEFIAGLGGYVLKGISGVFTIIYNIVKLLAKGTATLVEGINHVVNLILEFVRTRVKDPDDLVSDIREGSNSIIKIVKEENNTQVADSVLPIYDMAEGIQGLKPISMYGINLGQIIPILTTVKVPNVQVIMSSIIKLFVPVEMPVVMVQKSIIGIFRGTVQHLAKEEDFQFVKAVLPELELPPNTKLEAPVVALPGILNLPTREIIHKIPQFNIVFKDLHEDVLNHYNVSLYDQLDNDPYFNNQINLAIRSVIAQ